MRRSWESRGKRTQLSFSFNARTGDTFGEAQWGDVPLVNVVWINRELLSLRMSVQHLPSEFSSSYEAVSLPLLRYLSFCSKTHDFPWEMILPLSKCVNPADTRAHVIK